MKRGYVLTFLLLAIAGGPIQAKQLSKSEIRSIIQEASRHKGRYKVTAKIKTHHKKRCRATVLPKPKGIKNPTMAAAAPKAPKAVKKQEPILPFQLTPSFKNADVKIGQKGFVLIKGEPEKKKQDPLYKL